MNKQVLIHDEVDRLLPWYANDTLGETERREVSQHLDQCAACRDSLALLMQVKVAVNDHQAVAIVPEPRVEDLLSKVDAHERTAGSIRTLPWLIAASVAILAVTAAFLFVAQVEQPADPQYRTVTTSTPDAQVGYVINLDFVTGTTDAAYRRLLSELDATLIAESDSGSVQVLIPMEAGTIADLEAFTSELLRRPEVDSVNVIAVQLPVRTGN